MLIDETSNASTSSLVRQSLRSLEVDSSSEDETETVNSQTLAQTFIQIDNYREGRIDVEADLLQYWEEKIYAPVH